MVKITLDDSSVNSFTYGADKKALILRTCLINSDSLLLNDLILELGF